MVVRSKFLSYFMFPVKRSVARRLREVVLLLCFGDSPSAVLHPALQKERRQHLVMSAENGHQDNQRNGSPFLEGKAEIVTIFQSGERKASG